MNEIVNWVRNLGKDNSKQVCHHEKEDIWPNEEEAIWYLKSCEEGEKNWTESDAAYTKTVEVEKTLVCLGCGEERTIQTARNLEGEENIKVKSEMNEAELNYFRDEVHVGGFFNGWPEEHWANEEE